MNKKKLDFEIEENELKLVFLERKLERMRAKRDGLTLSDGRTKKGRMVSESTRTKLRVKQFERHHGPDWLGTLVNAIYDGMTGEERERYFKKLKAR